MVRAGQSEIELDYARAVIGADGSHSTVASVYYQRELYQIQGTVLPLNSDPVSGDTIRFQHSFRFTDFGYQ